MVPGLLAEMTLPDQLDDLDFTKRSYHTHSFLTFARYVNTPRPRSTGSLWLSLLSSLMSALYLYCRSLRFFCYTKIVSVN